MSETDKQALRAQLTAVRRALPAEDRARRSLSIAGRVAALPEFARARTVALYAPMGAEVDTADLARRAIDAGKAVAWPRLVPDTEGAAGAVPDTAGAMPDMPAGERKLARRLEFAACSPGDLEAGPLGTRQPPATAPAVDPASIDLICVPGVAFDASMRRLGRGGGHYDATLPGLARAFRVALAFDLQLVPSLPAEPHDAAVHRVATESRLLGPPPGRG